MAGRDLEARVIVCDPDNIVFPALVPILHARFVKGELPSEMNVEFMRRAFSEFGIGGVEFNLARDMRSAVETISQKPAPHYSLVIYETSQVKNTQGSAGLIADVRRHDFFLPQMIVGKGLNASLTGHCARAG